MSFQERVEGVVLRGLLGLPPRVQRVLAGKTVVVDGQTLAVDTQLTLKLQRLARAPRVEQMPVELGRPRTDHEARIAGGVQPIGAIRDLVVEGLPARLYTPTDAVEPTGLLVFFHGGGFYVGGLDSHDAPCRVLAEQAGVRLLAIDYRLAPEHPFPAAYDDAVTAYRWAAKNAESLGADPARLAVGGDSAGGNLAAGVALAAAREGLPLAFQLLIYPATDSTRATESLDLFADGYYLTSTYMDRANAAYLPNADDVTDPRASPLLDDVPAGLAPAYVATAGYDPLRDEGEAYARKLADAGVTMELKRFPDQMHGFFNIVGVGRSSRAAVDEIARALRAGLAG